MIKRNMFIVSFFFVLLLQVGAVANAAEEHDPLPSWNEGTVKQALIKFVAKVVNIAGKDYIAAEDRIATIDNDGTMWVEQPFYTQGVFAFDRVKELAVKHPEWKNTLPFSAILSGNKQEIAKLKIQDLEHIIAVTHTGMSVDDFDKIVQKWLATTKDDRYQHHYTELVYRPMLEVVTYLKNNGFKVYLVSGGGQDFMRAYTQKIYGIPPEQVIGTTFKTKYSDQNNQSVLTKTAEILFIDDNVGKPEAINLIIGRKPVIAFGNSDGDKQMLEWTESGTGQRLMLLVHHDDGKREYAYGPESKVGTFSNALMTEANQRKWQVISMKNDWKVVFPFDKN